ASYAEVRGSNEAFFEKILRHLQQLVEQYVRSEGPPGPVTLPPAPLPLETYRQRVRSRYEVVKLHQISAAWDSPTRAERNRVHLTDLFVPQDLRDCQRWVAERLIAPKELTTDARESWRAGVLSGDLHLLGLSHLEELRREVPRSILDVVTAPDAHSLVLLGDPGAGKSSLLQYLAVTWATSAQQDGPVPVLIELRQYAQHRGDQGLLAYAG